MVDQAEYLRKLVSRDTRILMIASGRKEAGVSNLAVNLAVQLAAREQSVILMDADTRGTKYPVHSLMGVLPRYTFTDMLTGEHEIGDILTNTPYGIQLIAGVSGMADVADLGSDQRKRFIDGLEKLSWVDYIIIDAGAGSTEHIVDSILASEDVIVVVTPEKNSVKDTYGLVKGLSACPRSIIPNIHVVANRVISNSCGRSLAEALQSAAKRFLSLNVQYSGTVPEDEYVRKGMAASEQIPFSVRYPHCEASLGIKRIVEEISHQRVTNNRGSGVSGMIQRLFMQ